MSQRKLFEPDAEPVFDSAYRPDARIVLVHGDSLEMLGELGTFLEYVDVFGWYGRIKRAPNKAPS